MFGALTASCPIGEGSGMFGAARTIGAKYTNRAATTAIRRDFIIGVPLSSAKVRKKSVDRFFSNVKGENKENIQITLVTIQN
jgi:hypothetical protein